MKGREERKDGKSGSQKIGQSENRSFPCLLLQQLHQPLVQDVERHSRMTGCSAEAVWNGDMKTALVGKEVAASCVPAAKFEACAFLSIPGVQQCVFCNFF
jgi:hypothetical protein